MGTPPQPPSIPLELPENLQPTYSNLVRISHSLPTFVFDFACALPGTLPARIGSRVLLSPLSAKLLYRALGENLARYEAIFGEIQTPGDINLAGDLFRSVHPPEPPDGK